LTRKSLWLTAGIGGLVLLAAALVWMQRDRGHRLDSLQLPLRPLALPPELTASPDLPAGPGALQGANLLLVTLDTTRPDRIGVYGNGDIETPYLDGLAREGVVFSRAFATAPTTLPTHASILTGLYPPRSGARANGIFTLGADHVTLAESLGSAGYVTAAFVSSFVLNSKFGLAQGFDVYDDELDPEAAKRMRDPERRADATTDRALAWLASQPRRPFFLWVHYYDPHSEYEPPSPYAEIYAGNAYDGEIAFVDAQLGRLLTALENRDEMDTTLIAVAADHGESLGDHGEASHGYLLYDAALRIPLVLRGPGELSGGVHVTRPVSQVDLMPTWLSLLGVPPPGDLDGIDLTRAPAAGRTLFAETLQGQIDYGWASLRAAMRDDYKLIDAPVPELYDRARDPGELNNLRATDSELAASLTAALAAGYSDDPELSIPVAELEPDDIARLEALGYGTGDARSERPAGSRPNPVEMIPVLLWVHAIGLEVGSALTRQQAIEALEGIVRENPDFVPASVLLADLHREYGDLEAALSVLRPAAIASGGATMVVTRLVDALVESDRTDEAISQLRALVARRPHSFEAQLRLGSLLLTSGKPTQATPHLRAAYKLDPDDPTARRLFARALDQTGRHKRATKIRPRIP
jgi:arylsulfatase A-like enzyme